MASKGLNTQPSRSPLQYQGSARTMLIAKGVVVLFVLTIAGPYFPGGGQTGLAAAGEIYGGPWFRRIIELSDKDQTYQLPADLSTLPQVNQQQDEELPEVHIFIGEELARELARHETHDRNRRSVDVKMNIKNENVNKNGNVSKNENTNGNPGYTRYTPSWCYYGPQDGYRPCYLLS